MGSIYDRNKDGKLDSFERLMRRMAVDRLIKQMKKEEEPPQEPRLYHYVDPYAWRENCEYNEIGIEPEDYETEDEYDEALSCAYYFQQEWIDELKPRERELARRYRIDPEEYAEYSDFRKEILRCIDREVEEYARKKYPRAETMEIPEDAPYIWDSETKRFQERMKEMKISAEKKKVFLQETFELLKDNYIPNSEALHDLIGKMAKMDLNCAVEMWKTLIRQYPDVLHRSDAFGSSIMYEMARTVGNETVYRIVAEDDYLRESIYGEAGDLRRTASLAIRFFIFSDSVAIADELLRLVYENKYKSNSFYEILELAIHSYSSDKLSEAGFEMIMKWINKVTNREEKAKLNLIMLNYMEDE